MAVSFNLIPGTLRVPLFYAEVDKSAANQGGAEILRTLLVGQRLAAGTVAAGVLTRVTSASQAAKSFGVGSMLHLQAQAYFRNDSMGEVYAIALDDDVGGTKATSTIKIDTVASKAGTLYLYVAGRLVAVPCTGSQTKVQHAQAIVDAAAKVTDLPCTAATDGVDTVTFTGRHKGTLSKIDLRVNHFGAAGGEELPESMGVTIVENAVAGAGDPDTTAAITAMGDEPFEFIAWPYTASTPLGKIRDELADTQAGRWGPLRQLYGHAFAFLENNVVGLEASGAALNDPHLTLFGMDKVLEPAYEIGAAAMGQIAGSARIDPARPLHTLPLIGVHAPAYADRFKLSDRNSLLFSGIATLSSDKAGTVRIERAITTYQEDAFGNPDGSMLDCETPLTLAAILRRLKSAITSKYGRHKLVNDGTRLGAGQAAVTPSTLRAELIAQYRAMEADGLVENADAFKAALVVERNGTDPSRVDVLFPPDLANGLRVFALVNQFRLQYPAAAA